jgi:hypothetical protein
VIASSRAHLYAALRAARCRSHAVLLWFTTASVRACARSRVAPTYEIPRNAAPGARAPYLRHRRPSFAASMSPTTLREATLYKHAAHAVQRERAPPRTGCGVMETNDGRSAKCTRDATSSLPRSATA